MINNLVKDFMEIFGCEGEIRKYFAPGRVNLIGEHTDYNGGHVFPAALTIGTYAVARKREDGIVRLYSENFTDMGMVETDISHLVHDKALGWANYPMSMVWAFKEKGYIADTGFDMLIYGNIPNGSGLSSSASLEVVTGVMLKDMYGFDNVSMLDIALYGQFAENQYNGVNCGIMDQFACAMGKSGEAMFLDTATLEYEYAPVALDNASIVIACSNKKRGLADSKYNERRSECEHALKQLQEKLDIKSLGDLSIEEFEKYKNLITNSVERKRAKHAVYENQRTLEAVKELKQGNLTRFGELMIASHVSLRDDYEVTGVELDTLVDLSLAQKGVIGSRMTGAGFGGCTVSIVENDCIEEFIKNVGEGYLHKIGYAADFYTVNIGEGGRRI